MAAVGRQEQSQVDLQKQVIQKQTDHLISLMKLYLKTTEDINCLPEYQTYIRRTLQKEADKCVSSPLLSAKPVPISPINDFSAFSDSDDDEEMPQEITPTQEKNNSEHPLDVFEIVFVQKSIGLKLIMDDAKRFVVVRECINDSEAKKYSDIYPGVIILAVNGTINRTLTRLRDAPRPLVVRFGHPNKANVGSWNDAL
ncbi:hypothetical protein THRCLA_11210 [Thraustotheca clavata]|uniref:PDZ domain-containing protein n=1 Tax=Thraustotheca clavata TaxID=74557 RepID=A0A1V9Y8G6_9STRA|nr:hypothetical protein THRCLA_11210 [Thraustotheca clavata]